jgi:hypothetical protein
VRSVVCRRESLIPSFIEVKTIMNGEWEKFVKVVVINCLFRATVTIVLLLLTGFEKSQEINLVTTTIRRRLQCSIIRTDNCGQQVENFEW